MGYKTANAQPEKPIRSAALLGEGLSEGVEAGVRCFSFHEAWGVGALSDGLDIPNDFAMWANNLNKVCTVLAGDTCIA